MHGKFAPDFRLPWSSAADTCKGNLSGRLGKSGRRLPPQGGIGTMRATGSKDPPGRSRLASAAGLRMFPARMWGERFVRLHKTIRQSQGPVRSGRVP